MVRRCMCGWHACMKTDGRTPCSRRSQRRPGRAKPPPADTPCLPVHPSSLSLRLPRSQHPPPCHTAKRARWDGDQAASAATRPVVDGPLPMLPTPSPQAPLPRAVAAFQTAPKPFSAEGWAHMLRGELSGPSAQVPAAGAPRAPAAPAAPFAPGDVVWAKLPTFPWWPAQVQAPETKQGRVSGRAPGTVFVVFYGRSGGGGRGEASSLGPGGREGTRTVPREGELHGCGERAAALPDGTPCTGSLHRKLSAAPFLSPPPPTSLPGTADYASVPAQDCTPFGAGYPHYTRHARTRHKGLQKAVDLAWQALGLPRPDVAGRPPGD